MFLTNSYAVCKFADILYQPAHAQLFNATTNVRSHFFLLVLGPNLYVAFDSVSSYVHYTSNLTRFPDEGKM